MVSMMFMMNMLKSMNIVVVCLVLLLFLHHFQYVNPSVTNAKLSIRDRCPITASEAYKKNGYYQYPNEVYLPNDESEVVIRGTNITYPSDSHYCYSLESLSDALGRNYQNYTCPSSFYHCPISMEYMKKSTEKARHWPKLSSLCQLRKYLEDPNETITLVVTGGSVTIGGFACGCGSKFEYTDKLGDDCPECSWIYQLKKWLESNFKAKIELFDWAGGGVSTLLTSKTLLESVTNDLPVLNGRHLIFMDHSYNDEVFGTKKLFASLQRAVEFVTRLYVKQIVNKHDPPHIFINEMNPRPPAEDSKHHYSNAYRKVAQHYGFRIYSYNDAVHLHSQPVTEPLHSHLAGNLTVRKEMHPPWHVHLFHAELIAANLMKEMSECGDATSEATSAASTIAAIPPTSENTTYVLPKPLMEMDETHMCNLKYPPELRMSFDKEFDTHLPIGSYHIPEPNTWKVRRDRKGRLGLISELNENSSCAKSHADVTFTLNTTLELIQNLPMQHDLQLHVIHLSSYTNAGRLEFYMCGELAGVTDVLARERKSIPRMKIVPLRTFYCGDASQPVTVTIRHIMCDCEEVNNNMTQLLVREPRKTQMVKIYSLNVCRYF